MNNITSIAFIPSIILKIDLKILITIYIPIIIVSNRAITGFCIENKLIFLVDKILYLSNNYKKKEFVF